MNTEQKLRDAVAFRSQFLDSETDSIRIFDGYGDGISDIFIDQFGPHWLLSTRHGELSEDLVQAVSTFGKTVYWKKLDQYEKDSPTLLCGSPAEDTFLGKENGVTYEYSFDSGYSQGLFLDQRENRKKLLNTIQPGQRILNTFAYTGAFSVVAAKAGATTTTLDLSQPYLDWAKRNMSHNDINHDDHYFCKGDTSHWMTRFAKSGKTFDGIILDPPTFSRDSKGKVFKVEKDYHRLVKLAAALLAPEGWILASTNCRKLAEWEFEEQLEKGWPEGTLSPNPMPDEYKDENYLKSCLLR